MLNRTAEANTAIVIFSLLVSSLLLFVLWALTSQLLPPDALSLLFAHVERRRPEVGHDHQELLKADLLHRAHAVLMEVPAEDRQTRGQR